MHDPKAEPVADWSSIGLASWRSGWAPANLVTLLDEWLELGRVRPRIAVLDAMRETRYTGPRIEFYVDGLYGAIGLLLLMAVVRSEKIVPCSEAGCSALARPGRRGTQPYCPQHGGPATYNRDRQRRHRRQRS
jgi:hypothetical protein